jgi:hypothetical protein
MGCQPFRQVPQVPLTLSEFPWLFAEVNAVRLFRMVLKSAFTWEKEILTFYLYMIFFLFPLLP